MDAAYFRHKISQWAFAYGRPQVTGQFRRELDDFIVIENLSFTPSGQGEHVYLYIQKRGLNTIDIVNLLAKFSGVKNNRISYAGLKDKYAQSTQWFSIYITGYTEPDWEKLNSEHIRILQITRHKRKLKRGAIQANQFSIVLRSMQGPLEDTEERLQRIRQQGVPNYFGEQRFGTQYRNLDRVESLVQGQKKVKNRHKRGIYYSVARAFIFNEVLSRRVINQNWNVAIKGDVMSLAGSRSFFKSDEITPELQERITRKDLHPSGPLLGAGESMTEQDALLLEHRCISDFSTWQNWLINERVNASRRALRVMPSNLCWHFGAKQMLHIELELPSGAYATSVLREIVSQH